jgi:peptidoglycan hydrolase-like protein with peptidoglycan-binding domain
MPLFSDLELRPTNAAFLSTSEPVQVATNDTASLPVPPAVPRLALADRAPLRILITRRDLRSNVRDLQALLNGMGYDAGAPDGMLGRTTVQAIEDFKKAHDVTTTGGLVSADLMKAVYAVAGKGEPPNGEVMVRQAFKPVFEAPAVIADPEEALGTHFFTAHDIDTIDGKAEWYGVTLENDLSRETMKRLGIASEEQSSSLNAAGRALDRITIPDDARRKIEDMLTSGSSLTISDTGVGPETGGGTDFITITKNGGASRKG